MNTPETIQGSDAWKQLRCGRVTASRMSDLMAKTKSGPAASRANYAAQLIAEILTGQPGESFTNAAMQWGTDHEPQARAGYEFMTDAVVEIVDFVIHPRIDRSGASPDGLVGTDGLVEIKAPQTATHIETLVSQSVPSRYMLQMQWQMACTGRKWCDFVSFDPRMPEAMQLFIKRVPRDDKQIALLEFEVKEFLIEIDAKVGELTSLYAEKQEAA